jgi:hypothetical protein
VEDNHANSSMPLPEKERQEAELELIKVASRKDEG